MLHPWNLKSLHICSHGGPRVIQIVACWASAPSTLLTTVSATLVLHWRLAGVDTAQADFLLPSFTLIIRRPIYVGVSSFAFTIIITHCVNQQCAILLIISRAHVLVISTMSRVKCTFNRWRTVVSGTWKYDNPRLTRLRPHVTFSTSGHHNFHVPRTTVSYVLSYGQLQESWIISGLQWRLAKREWVSSAM